VNARVNIVFASIINGVEAKFGKIKDKKGTDPFYFAAFILKSNNNFRDEINRIFSKRIIFVVAGK